MRLEWVGGRAPSPRCRCAVAAAAASAHLRCCLLVACGAVELAGEEEPPHTLGLKSGRTLVGWQVVVLDWSASGWGGGVGGHRVQAPWRVGRKGGASTQHSPPHLVVPPAPSPPRNGPPPPCPRPRSHPHTQGAASCSAPAPAASGAAPAAAALAALWRSPGRRARAWTCPQAPGRSGGSPVRVGGRRRGTGRGGHARGWEGQAGRAPPHSAQATARSAAAPGQRLQPPSAHTLPPPPPAGCAPHLVCKPHNLILNGWAVSRPPRVHPPPVHRGLVQILSDQAVRLGGGAREVAAQLRARHVHLEVKAEPPHLLIARLLLQPAEINCRAAAAAGGGGRKGGGWWRGAWHGQCAKEGGGTAQRRHGVGAAAAAPTPNPPRCTTPAACACRCESPRARGCQSSACPSQTQALAAPLSSPQREPPLRAQQAGSASLPRSGRS